MAGQTFLGEPGSVLNGAQIVGPFERRGTVWSASVTLPRWTATGTCRAGALCSPLPWLFLDGEPLRRVGSRDGLGPGRFWFELMSSRLVIADDPTGRTVEASTLATAFQSRSPDVRIRGLVIEKYSSPPKSGRSGAIRRSAGASSERKSASTWGLASRSVPTVSCARA
ncbi:hypothetical protein ACFQWF_13935 [Methylorubrum suomiense]